MKRLFILLVMGLGSILLVGCNSSVDIAQFITFKYGDTQTEITGDLKLVNVFEEQVVTWSSDQTEVISEQGKVTRPAQDKSSVKVTLKATYGDKKHTFHVTVLPLTNNKLLNDYPSLKTADHVLKEYDDAGIIEKMKDIINNKGAGIIYLGWPSCPYCREYVTYLNRVAKENDVTEVIYYNFRAARNEADEGKTGVFSQITDLLKGFDKVSFTRKNAKTEELNSFFSPTFIAFYNGEVTAFFSGAVEGHKAGTAPLTNDQAVVLMNIMNQIVLTSLGEDCGC